MSRYLCTWTIPLVDGSLTQRYQYRHSATVRRPLKYAAQLADYEHCPPSDAREQNVTMYRFVHSTDRERSFLPNGILSPDLVKPGQNCCSKFGLSMFTTAAAAKARHRRLTDGRPDLRIKLGQHLGTVGITEDDGLLTPTGNHRNLYEYENCNLNWTATEPL